MKYLSTIIWVIVILEYLDDNGLFLIILVNGATNR